MYVFTNNIQHYSAYFQMLYKRYHILDIIMFLFKIMFFLMIYFNHWNVLHILSYLLVNKILSKYLTCSYNSLCTWARKSLQMWKCWLKVLCIFNIYELLVSCQTFIYTFTNTISVMCSCLMFYHHSPNFQGDFHFTCSLANKVLSLFSTGLPFLIFRNSV